MSTALALPLDWRMLEVSVLGFELLIGFREVVAVVISGGKRTRGHQKVSLFPKGDQGIHVGGASGGKIAGQERDSGE